MRTDYTKPLQVNYKKPATKRRVDKKRLFIVFTSAFILFFAASILIVSLFTPKIDVPALNNEEEIVPPLTGDDFKGRLDPRLKYIEQLETDPPHLDPNKQNNETVENKEAAKQDLNNTNDFNASTKAEEQDNLFDNNTLNTSSPKVNSNNTNTSSYQKADPVPYKSNVNTNVQKSKRNIDILMPEDLKFEILGAPQESTQYQKPSNPPMPTKKSQPSTPQRNLDLRDKVDDLSPPLPSMSMNKVIVGKFATASRARQAADDLINNNPDIDPCIVQRNGVYHIQVGAFSTKEKAQSLVSTLNSGNLSVSIIQK